MIRLFVFSCLLVANLALAEVQIKCPNSFDMGTWVSSSSDNRVSIDADGIIDADDLGKYISGANAGQCYIQDKQALPGSKVEVTIKAVSLSNSIDLLAAQCRFDNQKNDCYHKPMIIKLKDGRPHYFAIGFRFNIKSHHNETQDILFQYSVDAKYQGKKLRERGLVKA